MNWKELDKLLKKMAKRAAKNKKPVIATVQKHNKEDEALEKAIEEFNEDMWTWY